MGSQPTPALELRGLVRRFRSLTALAGVSLEVGPGEVVALLGENGAGKSTLVEVVAGGLRPDGGSMRLAGGPYRPRDARQAWAAGVAAVHQHLQLVEAFTVEENLRLGRERRGAALIASAWRALQQRLGVPLPDLAAPVLRLGLGERQWLEVGRALLGEPRVLLLDEPTAVLTPAEGERLLVAVRRLAEGGTAVLFITHRLDEVRRVADRVIVLRGGRIALQGGPSASTDVLARAMTGELPPPPSRPVAAAGETVARLLGVARPPRLAPLDLELRAGEVVVLAGVDGNGQVAAAERLAGLVDGPGVVEVMGRRLEGAAPHLMRRHGVVAIPGDRRRQGVLPHLSVADNLALGRHRRPPLGGALLAPSAVVADAEELVARYHVVGRPIQPAGELSGGNQQKVVVARAIATRPRVLVAIHPTRGLDVAARSEVHRQLWQAVAERAAVLLVTADLEEARLLGDRILVLSRGRVVGEGDRRTPLELLARWVGGEAA